MFDEILEKLEGFIDLSPLSSFFFHESRIDARHDFVEFRTTKVMGMSAES